MRIALCCATRRGHLFLQELVRLVPEHELVVLSFRESPGEPPFLDRIRDTAQAAGGIFYEARRANAARHRAFWEAQTIDLMFLVNWRYMVPREIYQRPRLGTFVFHDSLLPRYRGFAPTVWAMINGDNQTGVTLFEIAEEVDAGDIVDQEAVPIGPDDTIDLVMDRVTQVYLMVLERNLEALMKGTATRRAQDHAQATYTCKRLPEDNLIDWRAPPARIHNLVRAVTAPYPGAYTTLKGDKLTIWSTRRLPDAPVYAGAVPGRVVRVLPGEGSVVLAADRALLVKDVQLEGGERVCASRILDRISLTLGR